MNKLIFGFVPITILAGISMAIVAITFDPVKSDGFVKFLFFASMTAFIWGCGSIVFFVLNFFSNDRPNDALRRGFFFSLFFLIIFILKKQGLLHWYTGFVALIVTMLVELWIYKSTKISVSDYQDKV